MSKFKVISFSKEIPRKFKYVNWIILFPVIFWPLIFYGSVFFFDNPNANPMMVWALLFGVNLYPIYLFLIFELNARLYRKIKFAGYILPLMIIGGFIYFFISNYNSSREYKKERLIENQKRIEVGYNSSYNTTRNWLK